MTNHSAIGALLHLPILDLTRVRAGPMCCRIFADFSADVIKIEAPPGVDPNEAISGSRKTALDRTGNAENSRDLPKPLPFGRASTPEEIGASIAFTASEHSGYTSGAVNVVDAGISSRLFNF